MKSRERFQIKLLKSEEISRFQTQLSEFEGAFEYPLGEQTFQISHGAQYSSFFDDMGEVLFAVLFDGEKIIGILAGIRKTIKFGGREIPACYYADFKIHPAYQKRGLSRYLQSAFIRRWAATPSMWLASHFGITMRKNQSDTILGMRNRWLFRRFAALGTMAIYFVSSEQVSQIRDWDVDESGDRGLSVDLSPRRSAKKDELLVSTLGKKDLVLKDSNETMNFVHFAGHSLMGKQFLSSLHDAGREAKNREQICFAVDTRRNALINHLAASDIQSNASATVYALPSLASLLRPKSVFVSTSEI